jgi:hypothetical protein
MGVNQPSFFRFITVGSQIHETVFGHIEEISNRVRSARVSKSKRDRILACLFLCLEFFQCLPRRREIPHFVQWTLLIRYSVDHGLKLGIGHLAVPG